MTLVISLPKPHEGQSLIKASTARFKVLACGRRFGKTQLARDVLINMCLSSPAAYAYFAPTYKMLRVVWDEIKSTILPIVQTVNEQEKRLTLITGSFLDCWSLDTPDGARGRAYGGVVIDEAAAIPKLEYAWNEVIRPTLTDKGGWGMFLSTPKSRNYFWQLFNRGLDPAYPEWQSWQFPTIANPYILPSEIEAARLELPDRAFRQEYLAEFLEDGGTVFRNIRACIDTEPLPTPPNEPIVFGVDWARDVDFTVITAIGVNSKRVYEIDRFHQVSWNLQRGRLKALVEKWKPQLIIAEENSIGQPNIEALQYEGLPIKGFMTTASSKPPLIDALALAFEQGRVHIPNDAVLISELESYELEMTKSGHIKYGAPEGGHDDTVISLSLAWYAAGQRPGELSFGDAPSALSDWRG